MEIVRLSGNVLSVEIDRSPADEEGMTLKLEFYLSDSEVRKLHLQTSRSVRQMNKQQDREREKRLNFERG